MTRSRLLVGSVSASRPTASCSLHHTLLEACDVLRKSGRTAAVITEDEAVVGVLTENDMLSPGPTQWDEDSYICII